MVVGGAVGRVPIGARIAAGGGDPCRLSPAGAIKAIQKLMGQYRNRPEDPGESLAWMLRNALLEDCHRTSCKAARAYPTKKKRERIGVPLVATATKAQIAAVNKFKAREHEFQLPA